LCGAVLISLGIIYRRQLLLWDKKTQLAKEMKELVHSDEGQFEVRSLKTEIHQMEVRSLV